MYLHDDVVQGNRGIVQLLIEVMSQQQNGIFQFAFAAFERVIPDPTVREKIGRTAARLYKFA